MKAFIVILTCFAPALVLKVVELMTSRKINSVGAKSNRLSGNIPRGDITNEAELMAALEYYKGLAD